MDNFHFLHMLSLNHHIWEILLSHSSFEHLSMQSFRSLFPMPHFRLVTISSQVLHVCFLTFQGWLLAKELIYVCLFLFLFFDVLHSYPAMQYNPRNHDYLKWSRRPWEL